MDDVNRISEIERDIAQANQMVKLRKKSPLQRRLDRRARHSIVSNVSDCDTDDEASYENEEEKYDVENLHVENTITKFHFGNDPCHGCLHTFRSIYKRAPRIEGAQLIPPFKFIKRAA